jgi:hypothetical protein
VNNLATSMKYSYSQSTKSLAVMGVSLQDHLNLSAIKHALGHKMPIEGPDSKMEIYPCDDTHKCATSI